LPLDRSGADRGAATDDRTAPIVVIGSGPAGMAAARALCDGGHHVVVLDAGDTIEAGGMDVFDALARTEPEQWPPELARQARGAFAVSVKDVPLKPAYGSLFPYALDDPDLPIERERVETLPSLARGGLSNSWGASIMPYRARDIEDWPIPLRELEPHYEAVLRFVPNAGQHDELAELVPLYTDAPGPLRRTAQTEMLLSHLLRHAAALRTAGLTFGASRLAVAATARDPHACRYCGLCLHGCPYGSIYNSAHTLAELVDSGRVEYRGGIYVDRLSENGETVRIDFHERGRPTATGQLRAARVFVACGTISSTRLMLDSMNCTEPGRSLQDSLYFVLPMLTARAAPVGVERQGNTLAQIFLELQDARISQRTVHLQLYGYNDIMLAALAARLPLEEHRLERLLAPAFGRLVVIQGYLHSAESPGLTLQCSADGVRLRGEDAGAARTRVRGIVRRLLKNGRLLGMVPLPGLLQIGQPGKGNHLGGSLPMRRAPGKLESDTLGRVGGWRRVHVVDAAVFPSVPATTVTLSVMANAHRIAAAALGSGGGSGR
jgi:choline dehydrogenase-like flavoprotein